VTALTVLAWQSAAAPAPARTRAAAETPTCSNITAKSFDSPATENAERRRLLPSACHRGSRLGFGRPGDEILFAPCIVRRQLEGVLIALLTLLEAQPRPIVLEEAQEFREIHLAQARALGDFQKVLIVAVQRVPAEVRRTREDDRVVTLAVDHDEFMMNADHDLRVFLRPQDTFGGEVGRGIARAEGVEPDDVALG